MTPPLLLRNPKQVSARADLAADVLHGLARRPKRIPSKYFYDARGSELFEAICELPEYYLTRTERAILSEQAAAIAQAVGPRALVVEYGSGSGIKTRMLLDALIDPVAYVPIEISESALAASVAALTMEFPHVQMLPLCADFMEPLHLPAPKRKPTRTLLFFPGSTLGNFELSDAIDLLKRMRCTIGPGGCALIGIDLKKDRATIEAAYNDSAGVTAEFTLNLLTRLNRELDANFDLDNFSHRAIYNELARRIETHIVSAIDQDVIVDGQRIHFEAREAMLVEYSCKYSQVDFERMAAKAGMRVSETWVDREQKFALQFLQRAAIA
ncbi:MAG: L-histidine N(alpha)-methyltransferase [Dokdonella sp.]